MGEKYYRYNLQVMIHQLAQKMLDLKKTDIYK